MSVLSIRNLSKIFPPNVVALNDASVDFDRGEIHCLLGANGAGKSTFLKLCSGDLQPTSGEIRINEQAFNFRNPAMASNAGISMIYQELDLVPQMTVAENLFLGHTPNKFSLITSRKRNYEAEQVLKKIGAQFSPSELVENLSLANRQLTAIARALTRSASLIIMDEPTAALNEKEVENVFSVIKELGKSGVSVIFVSHRLQEIREIGQKVTILRGGKVVCTKNLSELTNDELVEKMLGNYTNFTKRKEKASDTGKKRLVVKELNGPQGLRIKDFNLNVGQIVGLTGLNGSGRTTFLQCLFGLEKCSSNIVLDGSRYMPINSMDAISRGFGLVPEDRKIHGLVLGSAIYKNSMFQKIQKDLLVFHKRIKKICRPIINSLSTKYSDLGQPVGQLSGGNQQKVVLSKWIINESQVLLLDEPSRGLDIGAKADLYKIVVDLAEKGKSIVIASSELEELYAICDKICVLFEGENTSEYYPEAHPLNTIAEAQILGRQYE